MSFTEMFEKQRAFMLHASTCTSQYDEPHRRLYGEILGLLDEAKQAERERASLQNVVDYITMRFYQIFGRPAGEAPEMMDSVQALQADLDAALLCYLSLTTNEPRAGTPESRAAIARIRPLLEKRRENRG